MATTLPIEIFRLLEDKIGRDEAVKVSGAIELSLQSIENKANNTALGFHLIRDRHSLIDTCQ
jgi:hypothetical protein